MPIEPYRVSAYNLAKQSENKMHDDTVARRYGFVGALVPGVDVFAYMSHIPVKTWGRAFLESGLMDGRFHKPVYDGEMVTITAEETATGLSLRAESRGELCATGTASMPAERPSLSLAAFESVPAVKERKPVDPNSYRQGGWLGIPPYTQTNDLAAQYLNDVREGDAVYARDNLVHPGTLLRTMNWALMENAILGPWIHVGSTIRHLAAAKVGDVLTVRAKVTGNYEKKGHRFVDLDGIIVANGTKIVAHCLHTAIYQPREQAAA